MTGTSDFDYWQFWRNTGDADVGRFLRLFTDLPLDEVERLEALPGAGINRAKEVLAHEATALCRGPGAARRASEAAAGVFAGAAAPPAGLPTVDVPRALIDEGVQAVELLRRSGLAASNSAARRLIRQGGARVNDRRLDDESCSVGPGDLVAGALKLSAGKKRHVLVRAV